MPTYDYKCQNCGHSFEILQNMNADHLTNCPQCNEESLKRLIGTGAGLLFKGSGFYETDYRSNSYTNDKKKDSEKTAKDTKSAEK